MGRTNQRPETCLFLRLSYRPYCTYLFSTAPGSSSDDHRHARVKVFPPRQAESVTMGGTRAKEVFFKKQQQKKKYRRHHLHSSPPQFSYINHIKYDEMPTSTRFNL
jgi:hypothetical protein